jgi:ribonucleoside-diphosphate reductase alpha chain
MMKEKDGKWGVDFDKIRMTVRHAVWFLDNVIDMNQYPLPQISRMAKGNRKIGLGVMGLAHFLIRLGIPYNSQKALEVVKGIMSFNRWYWLRKEVSFQILKVPFTINLEA